MLKDRRTLKDTIVGELLREALGKLHHAAVVWSHGRPLLYSLWCVFYKAKFYQREKATARILCPKQVLPFGDHAKRDLQIWFDRLSNKTPPSRFILKCNQPPRFTMLSLFQIPRSGTASSIFLATPDIWGEYNVEDLRTTTTDRIKSYETVWLELLLDGLHTLDIPTGASDLRTK